MMKNHIKNNINKIVLVGVLKNKRDLHILLTKNWYRIPLAHAPTQPFSHLAFYQPAHHGREGKRIRYYARVLHYQTIERINLLPDEPSHPRAHDYYLRICVGKVKRLSRPIRNIMPRRVSFGFTTLHRLRTSKNVLQLYDIAPTEQIIKDGLGLAGIKAVAQYHVVGSKKRYCLDFAALCKQGSIAIECDNKKAHSGPRQREKDKAKNAFLRRRGWTVLRLLEHDIVSDSDGCMVRIKKAVQKLGGIGKEGE